MILTSTWEPNTLLLLMFPTWRSCRPRGGIFFSRVICTPPHLRSFPGPRAAPESTQPYSFKMFKSLLIKFAPVLLMLLLTLTVRYYSRILNWHPLLHVKKTAVKSESLVDTPSAAPRWWHPGTPSTRSSTVGCGGQILQHQLHLPPLGMVGFPLPSGRVAVKPLGHHPHQGSGNDGGIPTFSGCLCWRPGADLAHQGLFVCSHSFLGANNYRCNLSDLSV